MNGTFAQLFERLAEQISPPFAFALEAGQGFGMDLQETGDANAAGGASIAGGCSTA